jgi:hypothetical protein
VDGILPYLFGAMAAALISAALATWVFRWSLAALIGTMIGEVAILVRVPAEVWVNFFVGFLPFAVIPAVSGVETTSWLRRKVRR